MQISLLGDVPPSTEAAQSPDALRTWPLGVDDVAPGWRPQVDGFLASPEGASLTAALQARLQAGATVYPPQPLRALQLTAPDAVRVVVVGQDPYHGPGQANGLAFAVPVGVKPPPSLRNIFKELERDFGRQPQTSDGLPEYWAAQGVLLLNTCLTVEAGQAGSHARLGWQGLTSRLFNLLVQGDRPLVFMLWGAHAQSLHPPHAPDHHLWLHANHPSPLSALRPPIPFIGCGHFGAANRFLAASGAGQIDWTGAREAFA